jgi:hypothetical protein
LVAKCRALHAHCPDDSAVIWHVHDI